MEILIGALWLIGAGVFIRGLCKAAQRGDHDLELARPGMVDAAGLAADLDDASVARADLAALAPALRAYLEKLEF